MHNLAYDAAYVKAQINSLKVAFPELVDDYELLESAIDGETNFDRVVETITDHFLEALSMRGAIADRVDALQERGKRYGRKAESLRSLALDLMQSANRPKVEFPVATLSIRKGMTSVIVDDADDLPQGYFRTERVALKQEIKKALEKGEYVPGARLVTGEPGLAVRTK